MLSVIILTKDRDGVRIPFADVLSTQMAKLAIEKGLFVEGKFHRLGEASKVLSYTPYKKGANNG